MKARTRPSNGYEYWKVPNDRAYRGNTQRIFRMEVGS
jgi:hypothetical protein